MWILSNFDRFTGLIKVVQTERRGEGEVTIVNRICLVAKFEHAGSGRHEKHIRQPGAMAGHQKASTGKKLHLLLERKILGINNLKTCLPQQFEHGLLVDEPAHARAATTHI